MRSGCDAATSHPSIATTRSPPCETPAACQARTAPQPPPSQSSCKPGHSLPRTDATGADDRGPALCRFIGLRAWPVSDPDPAAASAGVSASDVGAHRLACPKINIGAVAYRALWGYGVGPPRSQPSIREWLSFQDALATRLFALTPGVSPRRRAAVRPKASRAKVGPARVCADHDRRHPGRRPQGAGCPG
jgi:hypothetical protein